MRQTKVIVCTQPHEPFVGARISSIQEALQPLGINVQYINKEIEQDPAAEGFWEMWKQIMIDQGARKGDFYVSSEPYGKRLAELLDGRFIPYDPYREIYNCKATDIRVHPFEHFEWIAPTFQHYLRQKVTFFGAESTGKTTLSKEMAADFKGLWLMEWARPYLEVVKNEITDETMTAIWYGQQALQDHAEGIAVDHPWIVQDTDLFSTVGYWDNWNGKTPQALKDAALARKSDLYIVTQSNIPFEADPLRYGGDHRETPDQFWIDLCEHYGLNYYVLDASDLNARWKESWEVMSNHWYKNVSKKLMYDRRGL